VGDCVFSAAFDAIFDMGLVNYTFPLVKNITPGFLDLNMTLGII